MKFKRLPRSFYARNTHAVAKELLGKMLVRTVHNTIMSGRITEVEAYVGEDDLACHASRGRTPRTDIMYGEAGHAYIYLIYGMYNCLNIVTDQKHFPAAVLIRALEPLEGVEVMQQLRKGTSLRAKQRSVIARKEQQRLTKQSRTLPPVSEIAALKTPRNDGWRYTLTSGPGKLTQALHITQALNGKDLTKSQQLYVTDDGFTVFPHDVATSPRIGVAYAKHCALYPWRYFLKSSPFISRK